jgi:hypothetical protein
MPIAAHSQDATQQVLQAAEGQQAFVAVCKFRAAARDLGNAAGMAHDSQAALEQAAAIALGGAGRASPLFKMFMKDAQPAYDDPSVAMWGNSEPDSFHACLDGAF